MTDFKGDTDNKSDGNLRHRGDDKNECGKSKSQINAEYFQALEQWLNEARSYKYSCTLLCGFPYTMFAQPTTAFPPPPTDNANNFAPPVPPLNQGVFNFNNQQVQRPNRRQRRQREHAVEYKIPPLWKRFIAEFFDFVLLCVLKMALTLIAVDIFDFVDFEKYNNLQQQSKVDYKVAMEITSEIFVLEVIHRLIVCLYETAFLRKGLQNQVGGATPGKKFVGIRVVFCEGVQPIPNQPNVVKVFPAKNLGIGWSFIRAFLKNFLLALLFPICFPFFFNKFNRTTYDILCHSIVVEDRAR